MQIDKEKLSKYIENIEANYMTSASQFDNGVEWLAKRLLKEIESGRFDIKEVPHDK